MNSALVLRILNDDPALKHLPDGNWQRVYGKMSREGATLVYEQSSGPSSAMVVNLSLEAADVAVRSWHDDPSLPALPTLLIQRPEVVPVRYRPNKRCTLQNGNLFLKLIADERGCTINRGGRMLWAAQQAGMLAFGVARPAGWLPSQKMMVQHRVEGSSIIRRLRSKQGPALARRLGTANASLASTPLAPPQRFTYADQMQRTVKYARRLAKFLPRTAPLLDCVMKRFEAVLPGAADRPIHGAPHAHQWLDGADGLKLVDFDRFSLGDPELDCATFIAETDFEDSVNAAEVGQAYLDGFAQGWPLDPALVHAYRLHKHVAKALRTATAIRLDAEDRTIAILNNVVKMQETRL